MQFHSSIIPVALPVSVVAGLVVFPLVHLVDSSAPQSLMITQWVCGLLNVAIGLPKNLMLADILSAIFVRPLSAWGTVALIANIFDKAT